MSDDKSRKEYETLRLLHKGLVAKGKDFPSSIDEVDTLENFFETQDIDVPHILNDPSNVFKRRIKNKSGNTISFPHNSNEETFKNFAQAARDGSEISESVRDKMKRDRERSEKGIDEN